MSRYDIPASVQIAYAINDDSTITYLDGGKINTTYKLHSPNIILQRLTNAYDEAWNDEYIQVQQTLEKSDVLIPKLIESRSGTTHVEDENGATWRAFILFENEAPTIGIDPKLYGQLLANTHKGLAKCDFKPEHEIHVENFHQTDYFVQSLGKNIHNIPSAIGSHLAKDLVSTYCNRLEPLPQFGEQIIHGDTKIANMLFRNNLPYAFIDWETFMWGSVWIDIGDMIRSIAKTSLVNRGFVDHTELDAVIAGYHQQSPHDLSLKDFTRSAYISGMRLCVELACRYLLDFKDDGLFAWDRETYSSAHEHNLQRAMELRQVMRELNPDPLFFIDYDRTLFKTDAFKKQMFGALARKMQTSEKELTDAAKAARTDAKLGGFDYRAFIRDHGADVDEYEEELRNVLRSDDHLYDDATKFTHELIKRGLHPTILTYGEYHFQYEKVLAFIEALGTDEYVVPIIVTNEPKGTYIARHYDKQQGILIDDKKDQRLPDGFEEVWLNRLDDTKASEPHVHTVHDLGQALDIIVSLDL